MLLREIGCPFELRLVDRNHDAQNSAAYLKLNPNGKIPVLVDDGEAISETGAIGLSSLADKFPEGRPRAAAWRLRSRRLLQVDGAHGLRAPGRVPGLVLSARVCR